MLTAAHHYDLVKTRFGFAAIVWFEDQRGPRITRVLLPASEGKILRDIRGRFPAALRKQDKLIKKFSSEIKAFTEGRAFSFDISLLDMSSVPLFHRKVLRALFRISKGNVCTYAQVAAKAGSPGGARAAGQGCANNPFPIVFPCHRVIRTDGSLGGFGGGRKLKRALLEMEGVRFAPTGKVKPEHIIR